MQQFSVVYGMSVEMPPKRYECEVEHVVEKDDHAMEPKLMKALGSLTVAEKRWLVKSAWATRRAMQCMEHQARCWMMQTCL